MNKKKLAPLVGQLEAVKALASDKRLLILHYLKDPVAHFPPQVDGDLVEDGVCADFIRDKLGISAATATQHLKVLSHAGLIRGKRVKQWVFYKRREDVIDVVRNELAEGL
ncbi:winged helix-turn-helix transcriptional regulator [Dyella jejuensis]|uniref:Winged helix-turn-helix transcriptional regulator n=1 Tax=Dyella jejuensis TaxID=1432009 RepID=A0ABW8JMT2_9GAMM